MTIPPFESGFMLAALLFVLGLVGVLIRRDILFVLLSIEIMLNACALAFVVAGRRAGQSDGQVMVLFVITVAAAEVAVGLGLALRMWRTFHTLDIRAITRMRG
jgi:NADH-quinone oxidoreductase subunit K